jgi:hypothetical protein
MFEPLIFSIMVWWLAIEGTQASCLGQLGNGRGGSYGRHLRWEAGHASDYIELYNCEQSFIIYRLSVFELGQDISYARVISCVPDVFLLSLNVPRAPANRTMSTG